MSQAPDNAAFPFQPDEPLAALLRDSLPPVERMAVGYAPARLRLRWLGLFALDRRFAQIVRAAREPMLGQLRLGWWREALALPAAQRPVGDAVIAALADWPDTAALVALADGWEGLLGDAPLDAAAFAALAGARGEAVAAIARDGDAGGRADAASALGYRWALADLAAHLSDPREIATVTALLRAAPRPHGPWPRAVRPIAVLENLASREMAGEARWPGLLAAMRIGLAGR